MPRKRLRFIEKHRDDPSDIPQPDLHVVNNSEDTAAMPVDNLLDNGEALPVFGSVSAQKIDHDDLPDGEDQQYFIAHCASMTELLQDVLCPSCVTGRLTIDIIKGEQMGYASKVRLVCDRCDYSKKSMASPRLKGAKSSRTPYEINRKTALLTHEIGGSHSALGTLSSVLGIPNMHRQTFNKHDSKVSGINVNYNIYLIQVLKPMITEQNI